MSGICGMLDRTGGAVTAQALEQMLSAMAGWGPDGSGSRRAGCIGLGHQLLIDTPEARHEHLPAASAAGDLLMTATARLDNREELLTALGIGSQQGHDLPDSQLILHAYQRWGESCHDHLLGDWAFAIWNEPEQTLLLARDHHGNSGVYYFESPSLLAFASSLHALLALPEIPKRLNRSYIAERLVALPGSGRETGYEGVSRLPPAHLLRVTPSSCSLRRYWWLESVTPLRLGSDEEYAEQLLHLLSAAVSCRLRSIRPVAVTLSGGLDSGAVASLAARELAGSAQRLLALSAVPAYPAPCPEGKIADERPLIESTAGFCGNIDVSYLAAEGISPIEGLERALAIHDDLDDGIGNSFWLIALLDKARELGAGVLLTGQHGNGSISWVGHPVHQLTRLLVQGKWHRLLHTLESLQRDNRQRLHRLLLRFLVAPYLPAALLRGYLALRSPGSRRRHPWPVSAPINPAFAEEQQLAQRWADQACGPPPLHRRFERAARLDCLQPGVSTTGALWQEGGASMGMVVRDPTGDRRVLEYCLSIPDEQFWGDGQDRWLVRRALAGHLPPEVLLNTRKGVQAADLGQRMARACTHIERRLQGIARSRLAAEILDIPRLMQTQALLRESANDVDRLSLISLLRGLQIGMFLQRFE